VKSKSAEIKNKLLHTAVVLAREKLFPVSSCDGLGNGSVEGLTAVVPVLK